MPKSVDIINYLSKNQHSSKKKSASSTAEFKNIRQQKVVISTYKIRSDV